MASSHVSLRLDPHTFERIEQLSRKTGQTRSQIAKTLLDEGVRIEAHPGVVFRSGPGGRRPVLAGGPDVWEVARVLRSLDVRGDQLLAQTAELTGLTPEQIRTAVRYYAEYRDEIDSWIARVDEEASREEAAQARERGLLRA